MKDKQARGDGTEGYLRSRCLAAGVRRLPSMDINAGRDKVFNLEPHHKD